MNIFWNGVEFRWQKWVIYSWKIFSWLNFTYKELDKQANLSFKKIWILTTKIYNCNEQAKMTFRINFLIQNFIIFFPFKTWGNFGSVNWQFSFYLLTEKTYSEVYHPVLTYLLTWVLFHWQHAIWYSNIYKRLKLVAVCLCLKGCENLISLGKQ